MRSLPPLDWYSWRFCNKERVFFVCFFAFKTKDILTIFYTNPWGLRPEKDAPMSKFKTVSAVSQLHSPSASHSALPINPRGSQSSSSPGLEGSTWGRRKNATVPWKQMASGRDCLLGNKEGMKSQGERGKQQKRNRLKEVVIKCEAGDFQGVFQLWRKSAAVLGHWFLVRFFFSKESLQLELWTRSQHQFNSNAGRTAVFKSFLQSERLPGASRHAPWGSVRLPALVGWAGQPSR